MEVLGAETINSLYPSLKTCSEDNKWRVRLELTRNILELAIKLPNMELFTKYLEPFFLNYLKDRVSAIRSVAIDRIGDLCKVYGVNWINSFVGKLS